MVEQRRKPHVVAYGQTDAAERRCETDRRVTWDRCRRFMIALLGTGYADVEQMNLVVTSSAFTLGIVEQRRRVRSAVLGASNRCRARPTT